jgi:hypothetical protein
MQELIELAAVMRTALVRTERPFVVIGTMEFQESRQSHLKLLI